MKTTSPILRMVSRTASPVTPSDTRGTPAGRSLTVGRAPSATPYAFAAGNPELEQIQNIAHATPQFKALCNPLLEMAADINAKQSVVASRMAGALGSWLTQLNKAKTKLEAVIDELNSIQQSKSAIMWVFDFGGNLSSATTPREEAEKAKREVKAALRVVVDKIASIQGLSSSLRNRVPLSQLNSWCDGPGKTMIEGVCPTFGVDQRDMLRGWWDNKYDQYLATGSIKRWQTVCDLYQHRVDHRTISRSYGSMASGMGVGSEFVLMRQPNKDDPRHRKFTGAENYAWGITLLEEGCLSGQDCPVLDVDAAAAARAVESMRGVAKSIKRLVKTSTFNDILAEVDAALSTANTKVTRLESKLKRVGTLLESDRVKTPIKNIIRAILQGPIKTVAIAALSWIPGWGAFAGVITGEVAVGIATRKTFGLIVDEFTKEEADAKGVRRNSLPRAASKTKSKFAWWSSSSNTLNKRSALREARALKRATDAWLATWEQMNGLCRIPYPKRTVAQWKALGVPRRCPVDRKTFEVNADIFELDAPTTLGPTGRGGGGTGSDGGGPSIPGGGAPEHLTPYGSLVAPQKAFPWKKLILTGIVGFVLLRNGRE